MAKHSLPRYLRKYFVAGMIVIIPIWVTIIIIRALVNIIRDAFNLLPAAFQPQTYLPVFGIEILIALILILAVGLLAGNYIGKHILDAGEGLLFRIPVVKTVYQSVKHLTTGIMSEKKIFSRAVLLEFPIKGLSFIGFVTGEIAKSGGREKILKIFIPTTPNPTSGYFCFAAESETIPLDISVDDAFKLIISAGYADIDLSGISTRST